MLCNMFTAENWAAVSPPLRSKVVANRRNTRLACQQADAADAKQAEEQQAFKVREEVAAATAFDDECRSVKEATLPQVSRPKQQLAGTERKEAKTRVDRA